MTNSIPTCARIGCDAPVHKHGVFCTDCVHWVYGSAEMPPVKPPKPQSLYRRSIMSPPVPPKLAHEPQFSMTNAELAEAIEWARSSIGKVRGGETAVSLKIKNHLFELLDVQAARAKAVNA